MKETTHLAERALRRASTSIFIAAAGNIGHIVYALVYHSDGLSSDPFAVVFGGAVQVLLFTLFFWLGLRVRGGHRLVLASVVLGWLSCSWILIAGVLALSGDYPAPEDLQVVQGCLVLLLLTALVLTVIAASAKRKSAGGMRKITGC